jgi:hypothetical protein
MTPEVFAAARGAEMGRWSRVPAPVRRGARTTNTCSVSAFALW